MQTIRQNTSVAGLVQMCARTPAAARHHRVPSPCAITGSRRVLYG